MSVVVFYLFFIPRVNGESELNKQYKRYRFAEKFGLHFEDRDGPSIPECDQITRISEAPNLLLYILSTTLRRLDEMPLPLLVDYIESEVSKAGAARATCLLITHKSFAGDPIELKSRLRDHGVEDLRWRVACYSTSEDDDLTRSIVQAHDVASSIPSVLSENVDTFKVHSAYNHRLYEAMESTGMFKGQED